MLSNPPTESHGAQPPHTFRLPSTALFLGLMPVFSGLARRYDLAQVLSDEALPRGARDEERQKVRTYIIYSGRESSARTSLSLFDNDPLWSEGELSMLIKRQFGPTGLKHLLGILIAAEEQANANNSSPLGGFVFDASRHLDLLGYQRSNRVNGKGYHTTRLLKEAREIVTLLCSLTIVQDVRLGARRGTTIKIRLLQDEASAEAWEETVADGSAIKERIVTNERIFLRFNPYLFLAAVEGTQQIKYMYTLQLQKLARENARTHGLTLTLGVHLPIKFRMNHGAPLELTARSFLRMAGLIEEEYTRYEHLERVENALKHMVEQGYLASYETERYRYTALPEAAGEESLRTGKKRKTDFELKASTERFHPGEPLEEMWRVEPPEFLRDMLLGSEAAAKVQAQIDELARNSFPRGPRTVAFLPGLEMEGRPPGAGELLKQVRKALKLQQYELAAKIGVTQAAVSMAEAGKRPKMAERLLELARRIVPAPQ